MKSTHELKFVFPGGKAKFLLRWLEARMPPEEPHRSSTVHSLYFDTADWSLLASKDNSDYHKTKVRLRWYDQPDPQQASVFIEAKIKEGTRRHKLRQPLDFQRRLELADPWLSSLPKRLLALGAELPGELFPVFVVSYRRQRFIEPHSLVRVCLDWHISATRTCPGRLPPRWGFPLPQAVLEVKGPFRSPPLLLKSLIELGGRKHSFSKYEHCYRRLNELTERC